MVAAGGGGLPKVGELLNGKYELVRTLGEGGMAVVFEARHNVSGQRVALKVLAPELTRDQEIVARFDREARAVGRLRTRHVAHVLEVDRIRDGAGGPPFIVMDFLDGCDLAKELENRKTLPLGEAIDYVLQACAAMDEAHRAGIIHRDLKPANLFLTNEPGGGGGGGTGNRTRIVKVLDFGISKLVGETSKLTGAGAVMGTVIYMSPEQVKSSSDVDRRTDIWSIGVILFELLAGRAPFEGPGHKVALAIVTQKAPNVREFAPDVPEPVAAAIDRMLERDLNLRFGDMREVATALAPFVNPGSVGAAVVPMLGGGTFSPPMRSAMAGKTMPLERAVQKKTLPLAMSAFVANAGSLNPPSPPSSIAPAAQSLAPISQPTPSSNRLPPQKGPDASRAAPTIKRTRKRNRLPALIAGGALGVLAAVGVVLIAVTVITTSSGKTKSATAAASRPPHSSPSLFTGEAPPSTTTTTLASSEPPPPPTMGRDTSSSASSSHTAARPSATSVPASSSSSSSSSRTTSPPASATPTSNPQLL